MVPKGVLKQATSLGIIPIPSNIHEIGIHRKLVTNVQKSEGNPPCKMRVDREPDGFFMLISSKTRAYGGESFT